MTDEVPGSDRRRLQKFRSVLASAACSVAERPRSRGRSLTLPRLGPLPMLAMMRDWRSEST